MEVSGKEWGFSESLQKVSNYFFKENIDLHTLDHSISYHILHVYVLIGCKCPHNFVCVCHNANRDLPAEHRLYGHDVVSMIIRPHFQIVLPVSNCMPIKYMLFMPMSGYLQISIVVNVHMICN